MIDLLRHEARRSGSSGLLLPVAAAVAIATLVPTTGTAVVGGFLVGNAMPAVGGLAAAAVAANDTAVELHLTVPTPYGVTVARRLSVPVASTVAATAVLIAVLAGAHALRDPTGTVIGALCCTLCLVGVAAYAAARWRSAGAASAVVIVAALVKVLVLDQLVRAPGLQSALLLTAAAVLAALAARRLADDEAQLGGGAP
jgi:hypothetical protein